VLGTSLQATSRHLDSSSLKTVSKKGRKKYLFSSGTVSPTLCTNSDSLESDGDLGLFWEYSREFGARNFEFSSTIRTEIRKYPSFISSEMV